MSPRRTMLSGPSVLFRLFSRAHCFLLRCNLGSGKTHAANTTPSFAALFPTPAPFDSRNPESWAVAGAGSENLSVSRASCPARSSCSAASSGCARTLSLNIPQSSVDLRRHAFRIVRPPRVRSESQACCSSTPRPCWHNPRGYRCTSRSSC